jgi:prevent-host-death family protein
VLRKISALKARQNLGQVMNEVALRGDDYIIEQAGRPLIAIIGFEKYHQLQRNYDELLEEVKEIRLKAKDTKSENIDHAVAEAVLAAKDVR